MRAAPPAIFSQSRVIPPVDVLGDDLFLEDLVVDIVPFWNGKKCLIHHLIGHDHCGAQTADLRFQSNMALKLRVQI